MQDVCVMHARFCHAARTARAPEYAATYVYLCQNLPCNGGWCINQAQEVGLCMGKLEQSYQVPLALDDFAQKFKIITSFTSLGIFNLRFVILCSTSLVWDF